MKKFKPAVAIVFALFSMAAYAQEKALSPLETIEGKPGGVQTTITYCRPSARGRTMIGGKEPFGEVWRTGANAATVIEFAKGVKNCRDETNNS